MRHRGSERFHKSSNFLFRYWWLKFDLTDLMMTEWIQGVYKQSLSSSDSRIPLSDDPRALSLTNTPTSGFEFGGMIFPIVISLYEGGGWEPPPYEFHSWYWLSVVLVIEVALRSHPW